jgi:protein O-mannosyl-transferase
MGRKSKRRKTETATVKPTHLSSRWSLFYDAPKIATSPLTHACLIIVVGLLAYSNSFQVPFQWDDKYFINENPIIRDFNYFLHPGQAKTFGMLYDHLRGRYVGYLSFALNYRVNGLDVTGYHIVNFFIHVINALLVYRLFLLTFRTPFFARPSHGNAAGYMPLFSAMLFISHPIQTEAVTYIYQRLASLSALFYMLSVSSYVCFRLSMTKKAGAALLIISLIAAVLGMKTKENAFTIPITIALYEFCFFFGTVRSRIVRLSPFVPLLLIIPLMQLKIDRPFGEMIAGIGDAATYSVGISRWDYMVTQFGVVITYLRLLLIPAGQNLDHYVPLLHSFFDLRVLGPMVIILGIIALAVFFYRRSRSDRPEFRVMAFGITWFFITISVESSVIPIQMLIDEYRVYLPSAGFFIAVTSGIFLTLEKIRNKKAYIIAVSFLMFVPIVFAFTAHVRNSVWGSSISLWEDVAGKSPDNIRAHNNLGNEYMFKGMVNDAIKHYRIALKLNPDNPEIHNNLGNANMSIGSTDKAIEHYLLSLQLKPDNARIHSNLGNVYMSKGLMDEAIRHYSEALKLKPDFADPHNNLGNAYAAKGLTAEAVKQYKTAIELKPDYADPHFNLGLIYLEERQKDRALKEFETALQIRPDFAKARKYIESIGK